MKRQKNVFGKELIPCSLNPLTGFFRDGCCTTSVQDKGLHNICVIVNQEFLTFSKSKGNDLITPREEFSFPGLKSGDKWCVCVDRWIEAYLEGCAPKIILQATSESVLKKIEIKILKKFAMDIN